jgi:hypothetical protein
MLDKLQGNERQYKELQVRDLNLCPSLHLHLFPLLACAEVLMAFTPSLTLSSRYCHIIYVLQLWQKFLYADLAEGLLSIAMQ